MSNKKIDLIYFLNYIWEKDMRRPYLEELSNHLCLICIEPPLTVDSLFRSGFELFKRKRIKQVNDSLYVIRPLGIVPCFMAYKFFPLRLINRFFIKYAAMKIIRKLEIKDMAIMITHPMQYYVAGIMKEKLFYYDARDAYSIKFGVEGKINHTLLKSERNILNRADLIFASSRALCNDLKRYNSNTFFVSHAASTEHFKKSRDENTQIPVDLLSIPKPRIGLTGSVNEIVDVELLYYVASSNPNWSIVLIGNLNGGLKFKHSKTYKNLFKLKNLYYLGYKYYEELPCYLRGLDVCLIANVIIPYTEKAYPNKLQQYLASGKPVVSTDLPEMRLYKDIVYIAKNKEEYAQLIKKALKEDSRIMSDKRIDLVSENSLEKITLDKANLIFQSIMADKRIGI